MEENQVIRLVPRPTERRRIGIRELTLRLHASRSTIDRWVRSGRLEAPHYLGARRLWFVDQVEAFEARARTQPASSRE